MSLEEMIAEFRRLSDLPERVARKLGPILEQSVRATAAAGQSPEGQPWAPRKDGGRAMAGAAGAVSVRVNGTVVRVVLEGPEVYWHFGSRGAPRRPVIPDAGGPMPASVARALEQATAEALAELAGR